MSNRKLKPKKELIKVYVINGGIFALLMAGFDWFVDHDFNVWKFVFHFLFFGGFMTFANRFNYYENK